MLLRRSRLLLRRLLSSHSALWEASLASPGAALSPSGQAEGSGLAAELRLVEEEAGELAALAAEAEGQLREEAAEEAGRLEERRAALEERLGEVVLRERRVAAQGALLEISPGVGGEEAKLFAAEILSMYRGLIASKGWETRTIRLVEGVATGAGGGSGGGSVALRGAEVEVVGAAAWELLRWEGGVHRVQRVPATERGGRIHTSAVAVAVMPVPESFDVVLDRQDLNITVARASGAGGQHVNTTESKVRVVHTPSGIAVENQETRSQAENRERCLTKLTALLYQRHLDAQMSTAASERRLQIGGKGRSEKVRTYHFPEQRVTEHRLKLTLPGKLHGVLSGGPDLLHILHELRDAHRREQIEEFLDRGKVE